MQVRHDDDAAPERCQFQGKRQPLRQKAKPQKISSWLECVVVCALWVWHGGGSRTLRTVETKIDVLYGKESETGAVLLFCILILHWYQVQ